jgi:predicted component of type VI protein secretion system
VRFAEAALAAAAKRRNERLSELAEREKALAAERKRIEREQAAEIARFETRLRDVQTRYDKALARWEKG